MDGLHPPASGVRVTFPGGKAKVTDGPFAEAKEVLGGYWMIDVKSKAEAIKWARQIPGGDDMTVEIRQVQEFEDFPDDVKNAAKSEPKIRAALEKKRKAAKDIKRRQAAGGSYRRGRWSGEFLIDSF